MAILTFQLEEDKRLKIGLLACVLSLLCVIPCIVLFAAGIYIQVYDQTKVIFVEDLDTSVLPACLIVFGILCIIENYAVGALLFLSRRESKRESITSLLFPLVIVGLVLSLLVMLVGILCFVQISQLSSSFEKGIKSAMSRYNEDVKIKEEVDILQIDYACCGNNGYKDWFSLPWMHVKRKSRRSARPHDDVPFSCCNPDSRRPCIHDSVRKNSRHFKYDHKTDITLHQTGCRQALTELYGDGMFSHAGALAISISLIQLIAVFLTRLVQTSFATAEENGDMFDAAPGYIFGPPDDDDDGKTDGETDGETGGETGGEGETGDDTDALLTGMSDDVTDSTFDEEPVYENIDDMRVGFANDENGNNEILRPEARTYYVKETPDKRSDRTIRNISPTRRDKMHRTSLVSRNNGEELTHGVSRRQSLPLDSVTSYTDPAGRACRSMSSLDQYYDSIHSTDMVHQDVQPAKPIYDMVPAVDNIPIPTGSYTMQNYCPNGKSQHGLPATLGYPSGSFQEPLDQRPEVVPLTQAPAIPAFPESMHTLSSSGLFFQTSPGHTDNEARTRTVPNTGTVSGDHVYESVHQLIGRLTHPTMQSRTNPFISETTSTGNPGTMAKNTKSPSQDARVPRRLPSLPKDSVNSYTNHAQRVGGTIPSEDNFYSRISSTGVLPTENTHNTMPSTDNVYETPIPAVLQNRPASVPLARSPKIHPKRRPEVVPLTQAPAIPVFPESMHTLSSSGLFFQTSPGHADNETRTRTVPNTGTLSGDHVYESVHQLIGRLTHPTTQSRTNPFISETTGTGNPGTMAKNTSPTRDGTVHRMSPSQDARVHQLIGRLTHPTTQSRTNPFISETTGTGNPGTMAKNTSPTRDGTTHRKSPSQDARVPRRLPSLPKDSVNSYTKHTQRVGGTIPSEDHVYSRISSTGILPTEYTHNTMPSTDNIYETPIPVVSAVGNMSGTTSSNNTQNYCPNGQSQHLLPNRPPALRAPEVHPKRRPEMETLMQAPITPEFPENTQTLTSSGGPFQNSQHSQPTAVKRSVSFYR